MQQHPAIACDNNRKTLFISTISKRQQMASEHSTHNPIPWDHALSITPSVTERRGARFGQAENMTEPLSVLALYSTSGYYVDIRVAKADDQNTLDLTKSNFDTPLSNDLEWAFAGKVEIRLLDQQDTKPISRAHARARWTRIIDSQLKYLPDEADEADLTVQPDRSILEAGVFPNPTTGEEEPFEEIWQLVPPLPSIDNCIVLKTDHQDPQIRGLVVRVGQWCQGILYLSKDDKVVERWHLEVTGNLVRDVRFGESTVSLPCTNSFTHLEVGGSIELDGINWVVVE
ncbi:hypothetical protein BGW36DRAFT_384528 [Talaromyces proteolyticus]|uniref:Protein HRI1 n=1 Tax=Talaromyces proteolyticus TaxID=1131652 RepID=A0AAD4KLY2_9EURO|nr:uncharacterized protein BGW36DRAFT_384528 [Talaromyces proteolyticus]KAH8694189.1 hypothetical protein BGW36DRAFT_384528 [Talaromyces proteolyticus]